MYNESKKYLFKLVQIDNDKSIEDIVNASNLDEAIDKVKGEYGELELYKKFEIRELLH